MAKTDLRTSFEKEALPHLDSLFGMAIRLTKDQRDAEDLVQDSMVKAFRFFHRFEPGSNAKAWLFKVLVNMFYNTCRKNNNIKKLHTEAEADFHYEQFMSDATIGGQNAEDILLDRLNVEKVRSSIEALPDEFKMPVMLRDLHDFSYKEIAEILDCPVGTVMSRLYRGRRQLQKKLHDYAVEQGYLQPVQEDRNKPTVQDEDVTSLQTFRQQRRKS